MVSTIKFSEFSNGGDLSNDVTTVGLDNSLTVNTRFNNPWTFLPPGTTGDRPVPSSTIYYRLRFNTTLEVYEYYDPTVAIWVQLSGTGTGTVNPGTANDIAYYAANGTAVSPVASNALSVLVSNAGSVPSMSTTLPTGLSIPGAIITSSTAALTAGSVVAAPVAGIDIANKTYVDGMFSGGVTSITGTTNQVIASSPTGAVTLSLPQDIAVGSTPTFGGLTLTSIPLGVSSGGSGRNSLTLHDLIIGNGTSSVTLLAPSATSGIPLVSQGATSDPAYSTAVVAGGGTGNTTFTAYSVITAGTTATGAFQNVVGVGNAGEQLTSNGAGLLPSWQASGTVSPLTTKGDIYTFTTVNARLAVGISDGQILQVSSGAATGLAWSTSTYPATNAINTLLYASAANVMSALATANSAVLVTNSTGVPAWSSTMTNGQLIIGSTGATPTAATITAGAGISVTNGAASITISNTGSTLATATIAGTSQSAAVNTLYIALNAAQTTLTLPAVYAVGDRISLVGSTANTGGWIVTASGGDTVRVNNGTTSAGGTVTSAAVAGQTIEIICDVANTSWVMVSTSSTILTTA